MSRHVNLLRNDQSTHNNHHGDMQQGLLSQDHQASELQLDNIEDSVPPPNPQDEKRKSQFLAISFVMMVVVGLCNKSSQVLMLDYIANYPLFLSLITTAVYVPTSFLYILPLFYFGQVSEERKAQRAIPMKTWILIGGLDSLAGIMQILTINTIKNGTLIVLLSQTAIPISMICSCIFLGQRYKAFHYIGVIIVLAGLLVVLLPRFLKKEKKPTDAFDIAEYLMGTTSDEASGSKLLLAIAVFIIANIPMCLSTVYKEISLGDSDVDPIFLNGWVAVWQFLISFPLLIPAAYTQGVAIKDLPLDLWQGAKCWVGINSYVAPSNTTNAMMALGALYYAGQGIALASTQFKSLRQQINDQINDTTVITSYDTIQPSDESDMNQAPLLITPKRYQSYDFYSTSPFSTTLFGQQVVRSGDRSTFTSLSTDDDAKKSDDCGKAPIFTNLYMFFNIIYNILIILLIKYGSANLLFMCLTITLPLSTVFFSLHLPFIKEPKPFTKWDVSGLIILLLGIIIYRFWAPISKLLFGGSSTTQGDADSEQQDQQQQQQQQDSGVNNGYASAYEAPAHGGAINSDYASYPPQTNPNNDYQKPVNNVSYYGEVNANVDDPFGDNDQHDGYEVAETAATLTNSSSNASDTTNHGRKKVKKGRK